MLKSSDDFINSKEIFKNDNQRERGTRLVGLAQGLIKNLTHMKDQCESKATTVNRRSSF